MHKKILAGTNSFARDIMDQCGARLIKCMDCTIILNQYQNCHTMQYIMNTIFKLLINYNPDHL